MIKSELQQLHLELFCTKLVPFALARGYRMTWGEAFRSDEQAEINGIGYTGRLRLVNLIKPVFPALAEKILNNGKAGGITRSLHQERLAIDTNLFKDGKYLTASSDWKEIGEYWESLHPLCRWGGRFTNPDGNHLSMTFEGVK